LTSPVVAAVDWGTTRIRVWLLDGQGGVLDERRSDEGMLSAAGVGFSNVLERHLSDMGADAELPAIVAGMAGARQGWVEAPYVDTPASLSDVLSRAVPVPATPRTVRIIPGIAQRSVSAPDVMRGEETQLAGIEAARGGGRHILCMPGTHSKWVDVEDGVVGSFGTWMTGELYSVIARESVLKHSVGGGALAFRPDNPAFTAAVETSLGDADGVTSRLFGVRAGTLLLARSPEDSAARLSGLLIGAEIAGARRRFRLGAGTVILVGSGLMYNLYRIALDVAGIAIIQAEADDAVRNGLMEAARLCGFVRET
jgi:2-dehydro-3-deoxygalactonokinase